MKYRRGLAGTLIVLLCILSVVGCKKAVGTPEDNAVTDDAVEEEVITHAYGFSTISMANPYYATLEASIREEVTKDGSTMVLRDAGNSAQEQIKQIDEMIEMGIELLFLSPVDWEMIAPELDKLAEAGIKVVNMDTQVKDMENITAFVGSDNKRAGGLCGEEMIKQLPEGGKVAILEIPSINSINDRITGFEEAIVGMGFEVVARVDVGSDAPTAKVAMQGILSENKEIDAVMCGNDPIALGVLEAVKEAKRLDVHIYSVDGSPDLKKEMSQPGSQIAGIAGQSPINMGKTAAKVAQSILNKEKYETETLEEAFLITKDNLDMYGVDGWQ